MAKRSRTTCSFRQLDNQLPRVEAIRQLTVIMETIVENYVEYRDYNTTTTQSDRGEQLFYAAGFFAGGACTTIELPGICVR